MILIGSDLKSLGDTWIPISDLTTRGFELLVFVKTAGDAEGEWYPIQGLGERLGVVVSTEEPLNPDVKIWVDLNAPGDILEIEQDMDNNTGNPVAQFAIKEYITNLLESSLPPDPNQPIILI